MSAKVAVFVSGGGTNLQAIIDAKANGLLPHADIELVASVKRGIYALERAENAGISVCVCERGEGEKKADVEKKLLDAVKAHNIDLIVLAGFLTILSPDFINAFCGSIINIHPSLIPSFCGKGFYGLKVHEAALERGVKVTGATVHFVNGIPDGGDIIAQKPVAVLPDDTPEMLQKRVMSEAEHIMLPECVEKIAKEICERRSE